MQKIHFPLVIVDDYPPVSSEGVWAEPLDDGTFRVDNIPFYSRDACLDDRVSAARGTDGEWLFQRVELDSGNSTLRIVFFDQGVPAIETVLEGLQNLGCGWEGMNRRFFSINVPATVSFDAVLERLDPLAEREWLDYEYGLIRQ
ncbi:DUF4265 domain-containing protein [Pseudomonas soli]|uniref:DUF4265 domain-containing protein n=1 Tax=Pseudomonas soli TaxID=1306993 RepID=A0AAJ5MLP7_9PSED|nr:DUF4265 domain-containing protein [Pseudomonas soli]UXZ45556.1 DUF4265 domain-containing protein [Pseudomonas soli]